MFINRFYYELTIKNRNHNKVKLFLKYYNFLSDLIYSVKLIVHSTFILVFSLRCTIIHLFSTWYGFFIF